MGGLGVAYTTLWLITCSYALVRGGSPERIAATAFIIAAPLSMIARILFSHGYESTEPGILAVDSALLFVLLFVAIRSARYWPMLMTSMHGLSMLGHLAEPLGPDIVPPAYYALVSLWSFPMHLLLAVGTYRHGRRLLIYGIDPAWSRELPESYRKGAFAHANTIIENDE